MPSFLPVSIPEMVRLIVTRHLDKSSNAIVSIPEMVRLIVSQDTVKPIVKPSFNSRDG